MECLGPTADYTFDTESYYLLKEGVDQASFAQAQTTCDGDGSSPGEAQLMVIRRLEDVQSVIDSQGGIVHNVEKCVSLDSPSFVSRNKHYRGKYLRLKMFPP